MSKNRILVPLDGSEFSQHILEQVKRWFQPEKAEIILYKVAGPVRDPSGAYASMLGDEMAEQMISGKFSRRDVEIAMHPIYDTQIEASIEANIKSELLPDENLLEDAGFTVHTEVGFGDPAEVIIDYVKRHGIDLVAMTTHGRAGVSRLLMGSVAGEVLQKVSVPVLLFRPFAR